MPDGGTAGRSTVVHAEPTDATVKQLYGTALRCGLPGCLQTLYRASETGERVLNSRVAHIHARREGGPRWDPSMSEEENRSYSNLILLCIEHAYEIDDIPDRYPAEQLREWKRVQVKTQEQAARQLPALTDDETAEVCQTSFTLQELGKAIREAVPFSSRSRTRDEALDRAVRESASRRKTRLLAVPDDRQGAVLAWMAEQDDPVVQVPEGRIRVLIAPMGAGKSEEALRWWDEGLAEAQSDAGVEIPVWLDARGISGSLDTAVTASLGRDPDQPCRVVIDDLDGVSPGEASRLLAEARLLTGMWPRTRVLATSRPGITAGKDETITVSAWAPDRGAGLVRVITGRTGWYPSVTETADLLTSPLTASAVAARLIEGQDTTVPRLTLLRDLAQTIIQQHRPDTATPALWDELARLAARILSQPGPVAAISFGNEAQIWQLAQTGLVVSDNGGLRFALPLFEQHFGAQALASGIVAMQAAADRESFPRWRYAIAFALSTQPERAEEWMLLLARTNPAVVSWTLNEFTEGSPYPSSAESPRLPAPSDTASPGDIAVAEGRRLREALQALLEGFGTCRTQLSRHRNGDLVQWGVQLFGGGMLAISHARDVLPPPDVVALTSETWGQPLSEWPRTTLIQMPRRTLGRWFWARNELTEPLTRLTHQRRLPVPPGSPLAAERLWVLAVRIMQLAKREHGTAIPVAALQGAVDPMMEHVSKTARSTWNVSGMKIDSDDIRWIHAQLQYETREEITAPWPDRDRPGPRVRWRWEGYSPELAQQVVTDVLAAAVTGYRDLITENFARFGWALGLNSALPVLVEGTLVVLDDDPDGVHANLHYQMYPAPTPSAGPVAQVRLDLQTDTQASRRGAWVDARPYDRKRIPFYTPAAHTIEPPTGLARPATNLAYEWLAADLRALGWLPNAIRFHN